MRPVRVVHVREALVEYFELGGFPEAFDLAPRYNVAPGQAVAVVRNDRSGNRVLHALRWGLVPYWAKDPKIGYRLINARAEGLSAKPAFREAAARRHCLIAASGFYEWAKPPDGQKQAFFISAAHSEILAFAGLWERWRDPAGATIETCVIVTTEANSLLAPIHDRMPVVLAPADQRRWLDATTPIESCLELARNSAEFHAWPVGPAVNDARNDGARLIESQG